MLLAPVNPERQSIMDEFRLKLRRRMDETGMSISELARRAQVNRPFLHKVLDGSATPTLGYAERLAQELGFGLSTVDLNDEKKSVGQG